MIYGLLLLIATGFCWTVIGIVVSRCAHSGINYNIVQGLTAGGNFLLSLFLIILFSLWPENIQTIFIVSALFLFAGVANYFTYVLIGRAMKYGHNGLIWALMQSGMVSSFLMGALFFQDRITTGRILGVGLLLLGIFLMGSERGMGNCIGRKRSAWLIPTAGAVLLVGVTHCTTTLPSYFSELRTSPVFRMMGNSFGIFACYLFSIPFMPQLKRVATRIEWKYAVLLLFTGFLSSGVFFYNALDLLAEYRLTGIGYPVSIGICITSFMLYSTLILKEKASFFGWLGIGVAVIGIFSISF